MALDVDAYSFEATGGLAPIGRGTVLGATEAGRAPAGVTGASGSASAGELGADASTLFGGDVEGDRGKDSGEPPDVLVELPDAAVTPLEPVDACVPRRLYRDRDGDGFGAIASEDQLLACPQPGWVERSGDCHDATPSPSDPAGDVWPGQTATFAVGYPVADSDGQLSFDYDCSGSEEPDTNNLSLEPLVQCQGLLIACVGQAYRPDARAGDGVDPRCGSVLLRMCSAATFSCEAIDIFVPDRPFRCR